MSWAGRRKTLYLGIVSLVLLAILVPLAFYLYPNPTCFDNKQNQDELGVDCDGSCEKVCLERAEELQVLWARPFKVTDGVYSAVSYISNQNVSLGARNVSYSFKFYDNKNLLVAERSGRTDVPPNSDFPVFEGLVTTQNRVPTRVFFEFTKDPTWRRLADQPIISVKNSILSSATTSPRLEATVVNDNVFDIDQIVLVAILYDKNETAVAASETTIDLLKNDSKKIVFTWPTDFSNEINRIEISPKFFKE